MFYDIYLDEVFYLGEENVNSKIYPNIFEGLDHYSKVEINNFINGKVKVLRKEKDIFNFIKTSRNILSNNEKLYYGKINEETANKILSILPYNLKGFNLSLQRHNFKHIEKKHGNPIKEITRGQSSITEEDFCLIPSIIKNFDNIKKTYNNEFNNKSFEIEKEVGNSIYHVIFYISFKKHNLEIKTIFKKKKKFI